MDQHKSRWDQGGRTPSVKGAMESRYAQMLQWANYLTRGNEGVAREIVQDLCLQLTLSNPNFDEIGNLDGYLYTCLRHLYLSRLTRASREAARFVSIEDCDSIPFALENGQMPDSVDVQNQLRRICSYSLWRREASKGFSCFILHFFHGYFHREISDVACLPMAAIYNRLKAARTEIKSHLREPEKLQFLNWSAPPQARLSWTAIPSPALFRELREMILAASVGSCLPEQELLSLYRSPSRGPIPCALLAHIVSCRRCLDLIDRHFQRPNLENRDALDGYDRSLRAETRDGIAGAPATPLELRRRRLYEHRPIALSIAINGRIVASRNVQGETSVLSARIDRPENAPFVEVFSDQDVRLVLLPVEALPPQGAHLRIKRVELSDDRWLEVHVAFDGLGLGSELIYCDPALAMSEFGEGPEELPVRNTAGEESAPVTLTAAEETQFWPTRWLSRLWPSTVPAWALAILCMVITGGWIAWRIAKRPLSAQAILQRSIESEAASLKGNAEHEEFLFEQVDADGHVAAQGTVDVWKDGSRGRMMRRLFDADHHLVAATWRLQNGTKGSYVAKSTPGASRADRKLVGNRAWSQDVSSEAFRSLAGQSVGGGAISDGYVLTAPVHDAQRPQVVAATLILNRRFHSVGETLRMRTEGGYAEVRYRQISFETRPAATVADSVFDPDGRENNGMRGRSSLQPQGNPFAETDTELAKLELAVLYRLFVLHVDADQPIEIMRTPEHRIRVEGTVADGATRSAIFKALTAIPDHESVDLQIHSSVSAHRGGRRTKAANGQIMVYTAVQSGAPADAALRRYLAAKGELAAQMDAAIATVERDALQHAQHALQQAYALDRLGNAFSAEELRSLPPDARRQWSAMVAGHAEALREELLALHQPLFALVPSAGATPKPNETAIGDPGAFARDTGRMLQQVQTMNRRINEAFTSGVDGAGSQNPGNHNPDELLTEAIQSIPLPQAQALSAFAERLNEPEDGENASTRAAASPRHDP